MASGDSSRLCSLLALGDDSYNASVSTRVTTSHRDFDIRYHAILDILCLTAKSRILEVGALPPAALSIYLPTKISYLGLNREIRSRKWRVRKMNFPNSKFSAGEFTDSICTDTLEHVPRRERRRFVEGLVRVTSGRVIIGVPNPEAAPYEQTIVELLNASRSGRHYLRFFKEHILYGIPTKKEMRSYLEGYSATEIPNFSLAYWVPILMADVFKVNLDATRLRGLHKEPTYRTFYIIKK